MGTSARIRVLVLGLLLAALATASSAQATYPGENGKIYFQACGEPCVNFDIYAVEPDGSGLENVTDVVTGSEGLPNHAFNPAVSADGKVLAFGVDTQATAEIWVMNTDGTGAKRLTNDNLLDQEPTISADGTRIAWNQWSPFPGYTDSDIWVMGADGSKQELLFDGFGTDVYPEFTADGQTVVMAAETGDMDIRKIPSVPLTPPLKIATGVAEDDNLLESEPTISPDDSRVAFAQVPKSASFGPRDIYSVGIGAGATTPVYITAASETSPAYSPDGTKLVFNSDGVPMIGSADGSGTPAPLHIGALNSAGRFEWVPKPPKPQVPPAPPVVVTGPPPPPPQTPAKAPQTKLRKHPKKVTKDHAVKFTFSADQAGSTFECKLDRRPFKACGSPFKKTLAPGRHSFRVRAVNPGGARDGSPATFGWKILAD